jgi:hypothetical protein
MQVIKALGRKTPFTALGNPLIKDRLHKVRIFFYRFPAKVAKFEGTISTLF